MSLWIKCDLCGGDAMHPVERNKEQSLQGELEDWLMMNDYDFCPSCLVNKLGIAYFSSDRLVLKKSFNKSKIEKIVKEKGV